MLRAFFLSMAKARWAQRIAMRSPLAWRVASRFVAGKTLAEALPVVEQLNQAGIRASLDHLGENVTTLEEARQATGQIILTLRAIETHAVQANVSVKLTQIGLAISDEACAANLARIAEAARECHNFVRVDMEDSAVTGRTLAVLETVRSQGYDNLGIVLQAYLYRSEADLQALIAAGVRVRLCKGAYREPPEVAFPNKKDVDANFDRLAALLLSREQSHATPRPSADGRFPPLAALATHDDARIVFAHRLADRLALPKEAVEFQMLYGIRRDLQQRLAAEGYPVRVYVPFGQHWYPYYMRRLGERPANLWFVLSNLFRR